MKSFDGVDDLEDTVGLHYWLPDEAGRFFFGSAYLFTTCSETYGGIVRAEMPQLRFLLSGSGFYEFSDGRIEPVPDVGLVGPTMNATRFTLRGAARVIGVPVLPLGWLALGCGAANHWVDRLYDGAPLRDPAFAAQHEALRTAVDIGAAVAGLQAFLAGRLQPVSPAMRELVSQIDHWLLDGGVPRLERIVADTGLSARQLSRYTNRLYGAPPKLLARKYRALRCASRIVLEKKNWSDLCDGGRFYDQSHFIREIKQFLGYTPHQLLHEPSTIARLAMIGSNRVGRLTPLPCPAG